MVLKIITLFLPWPIRRLVLKHWFKFEIHPSAKIGFAWIYPHKLCMAENTKIDHFNFAIHLDKIEMEANSSIGRNNWITGLSTYTNSQHFKHQMGRRAELILKESSNITKNHHLDCTNTITIGRFTTIAGYNSQFLTHSIDVFLNRQDCAPINIGDYCFVGTNVVVLGGAALPSYSVLGAKSLLNKQYLDEWQLYGGVPAKSMKQIPHESKYFTRTEGYVY